MSLAEHHPPRLPELDALRGLAALVVFSSHCILLLPRQPVWLAAAIGTPLGLFLLGGHQAVILFFLLSGFVLYLPHTRLAGTPTPFLPYAAKRVCRIYLPYLASILVVVAAYTLVYLPLGTPAGVSPYYSWRPLAPHQMAALFVEHILFLGSFHREYWNSATWSLAEELRISLVFPLLAATLRRLRWPGTLALALAVSAATSVAMARLHHRFPLATLHYAAIFLLGAILSTHHLALIRLWQRLGRPTQTLLILLSIAACAHPFFAPRVLPVFAPEEAADWIIALTSATFLIAAISHTWFSTLLRHRAAEHLGRVAYSFYLLHLPWLLTLTTLLWNRLPPLPLFALALLLTLLSADLFFRFIERPSIALGKHLSLRLRAPRPLA